jgi:hypothetical protein
MRAGRKRLRRDRNYSLLVRQSLTKLKDWGFEIRLLWGRLSL